MYLVKDLFERHGVRLGLELSAGKSGINRRIRAPEAQRPGLSLCGYLKNHTGKRVLIFGRVELGYLNDLDPDVRIARLENIITEDTPAVIIARRYRPPKELKNICERHAIPLFRTHLPTMDLLSKMIVLLTEEFAPSISFHGTLVEVFGVGVLIQGDSAVGKSEAALAFLGHRIEGDQAKASGAAESLHSVGHLKLIVDVGKVKIDGALGHEQKVGDLFARLALDHQRQHLNLALGQFDRFVLNLLVVHHFR